MEALGPDDLSFDVDVEIPNENDVRLVAQVAEQELRRENLLDQSASLQAEGIAQRVVLEEMEGNGDISSAEEEDAVKTYCENAIQDVVMGKSEEKKRESSDEEKGDKEEKENKNNSTNPAATEAKNKGKKTEEPPTLNLNVPEKIDDAEKIELVGTFHAYLEGTVVVRGQGHSRALDLQSLVCMENRTTLGVVCDTFGSVEEPFYLVFVTSPDVVISSCGQLDDLEGKQVFAVASESSFALEEEEISKALAGLSFMQPLEEASDCMSDDSTPTASPRWLQQVGVAP